MARTRVEGAARGRPALLGLAIVGALLVALFAPVAGVSPATEARAADTDLTLVTDATYAVQPARGLVQVSMSIVARNHRGETRTHKYYFDRAFLAVLPG